MGEVAKGGHTLFVGEVVEAGVRGEDQTILMCDHNLNYGGYCWDNDVLYFQ